MCLFSGPVRHVSGTRIYAAPREGSYQRLAYAMLVELPRDLAMVLPIPTPPRAPEDAVRFVDMSSCVHLLEDLDDLFEEEMVAGFGAPQALGRAPAPATLVVHDVGDFEASFVPTLADFARLDRRFRMPDDVWAKLPAYADWGFCVFKLRAPAPAKRGFFDFLKAPPPPPLPRKRHPMAFDFPRRDARELFFPTVHVHDGEVHPVAHFDHTLYAQLDRPSPMTPAGWEGAAKPTATLSDAAKRFVHGDRHVFRKRIRGMQPNGDWKLSSMAAVGG